MVHAKVLKIDDGLIPPAGSPELVITLFSMDLVPIIRDLLLQGQSVTIPELGTVRVFYHPAGISREAGYLIPPSGEILFDATQFQNNGFLERHIMMLSGCSPEEAKIHLGAFTGQVLEKPREGHSAVLTGLGTFNADQHGLVMFEADAGLNLCPDAYGLTPFRMHPISTARKSDRKKHGRATGR
jgi:hypothetical protein